MHPELLKKLFTWAFHKRPCCQFFITTHSSILIDKVFLGIEMTDISFYEIYSEKGITRSRSLNEKLDQIRLLEQMGFQSSNLLLANYVIWVEGPSDIFYYEALLNIMDKLKGGKIKRGVHYELMWYGGRQVKNMRDIKSKEGLNLLLSFARKGAIFWDYDGDQKYTEKLAKHIKEFKETIEEKSRDYLDFCFGCTGKMMSNDGVLSSTDNLPHTIENLMSKDFAELTLLKVFPKTDKKKIEEFAIAFEKNIKLEGNKKHKLNKKKMDIGKVFLAHINERLKSFKAKYVFKDTIASERHGAIMVFFDKLYQNILNANK